MANRRTKQDYDNKYIKEHYKRFMFRMSLEKDSDLISYFYSKPNKNEYLKQLIAADMKKSSQ